MLVLKILLRTAEAKNEWKKNGIGRFSERKNGVSAHCGNPGKIKRCFVLASCGSRRSANGKPVNEYQDDVFEQVRNDIKNNVLFIESKITQYGLDGYSMYIYLLPFADADEDKKDIMDKLLQSGGGQA